MNNIIRKVINNNKLKGNKYSFNEACNLITMASGYKISLVKLFDLMVENSFVSIENDVLTPIDTNNVIFIYKDYGVERRMYLSTIGLLIIKDLWTKKKNKNTIENISLLYLPASVSVRTIDKNGDFITRNSVLFVD